MPNGVLELSDAQSCEVTDEDTIEIHFEKETTKLKAEGHAEAVRWALIIKKAVGETPPLDWVVNDYCAKVSDLQAQQASHIQFPDVLLCGP